MLSSYKSNNFSCMISITTDILQ